MKKKCVPQKRLYRQRAHCNPLSDSYIQYPLNSKYVDWTLHYPNYFKKNFQSNGSCSYDHGNNYDEVNELNELNDYTRKGLELKVDAQNRETKKEGENIYATDTIKDPKEKGKNEKKEKEKEKEKESETAKKLYLNTNKYPISYGEIVNNICNFHKVQILDIGCGYGGLLFALSKIYCDKLILGMEIRDKITNYVGEKINAYRINHYPLFNNISIIRTNAIKFLPNYIEKNQIEKLFFCFPDPHFKKKNWKRRIITLENLPLYYHILKHNGLIYFITDVYTLYLWVKNCFIKYPHFKILSYHEYENDVCVKLIQESSEESKKVKRNKQRMFCCVVQKIK